MKPTEKCKDLKINTTIASEEIKSETEHEILSKIKKREEESEALKKLLINLNEPITNKKK